jgi:peptidoglycan/xylan/chitin deacetylase (PgdA/CDA1 family)
MDEARLSDEFARSAAAFEKILGRRPLASGAPGWVVSAASLRAQDRLDLDYASDLRGGPPCRLRIGAETFKTVQIATTTLCIEELLASERGTHDALLGSLLGALDPAVAPPTGAVLPIHAEVDGGPYLGLFEELLTKAASSGTEFVPLGELARALDPKQVPVRELVDLELAGRADPVASSAPR